MGIALGPGRGPNGEWLGDLEGDGPQAADSLEKFLDADLLETMGWGSTRGSHNTFIIDGERLLDLLKAAGATEGSGIGAGVWHLPELPGLEFRIGGYKDDGVTIKQIQSVCPPTIGDDGKAREWNGVETIATLPEAAYSLLAAVAESRRMVAETEALLAESGPAGHYKSNGTANGDGFTVKAESSLHAYGRKALEEELALFSRLPEGERHAYLPGATLKLASSVKAGAVTEAECLAGLKAGARKNGMGEGRFHEIDKAWQSGYAMANARNVAHVGAQKTTRPTSAAGSTATSPTGSAQQNISFTLLLTKLSTIKPEPVEYLVEDYIFRGKVNMIAGAGGRGKSTLLYDQIASHTLGKPAFGLTYSVTGPIEIFVCSGEEYFKDTIVPRLMAVGANLDLITRIDGVVSTLGDTAGFHLGYIRALESELLNNPKVGLVVMDPITSLITGAGANQNDEGEVRELLEKLKRLAEDTGVTFELVKNFNKDESKSAAGRVSGTHAYTDECLANYIVEKDPSDAGRRIFAPIKINGPDEPSSFAFRLEILPQDEALRLIGPCEHLTPDKRLKLASQLRRPVYEGKTSLTADDLVKKHIEREKPTARINAAADWLKSRLELGPAGSVLVALQGDLFLGLSKSTDGMSPDDKKRLRLGRVKWWREQILKAKLGGASRKLQLGWEHAVWFFTIPGSEWPPSQEAVNAAAAEDKAEEGASSHVQF